MKGWMGRNTSAGRRLAAYATDRSFGGTRHRPKTLMAIHTLIHQIELDIGGAVIWGGLILVRDLTVEFASIPSRDDPNTTHASPKAS